MTVEQGEVGNVSALAVAPKAEMATRPAEAGIHALARMSDERFEEHLALLKTGYSRLKKVQRELMKPGVHFGMPGAKVEEMQKLAEEGKVGLYKAGAEVLCQMLSFVAGQPDLKITYGDSDNESSPAIIVHASVPIHRGSTDGPVVGVGVGAWSTWEIKNRYRRTQRACPACGKPALIHQAKAKGGDFKDQEAFWCAPFKGGCSANFAGKDPKIVNQPEGRETNRDAADLLNTGVKMGTKRAYVDGVIRASGSSDLFTQDVEDMKPEDVQRHAREVAAGADETVAAMYGDGDPDAWRNEEAKPAAPQVAATAPSSPSPAGNDRQATDRQWAALGALMAAKLGIRDAAAVSAELQGRFGTDPACFLTVAEASRIIGELNKLPDLPKGEAAPSRAQAMAERPAAAPAPRETGSVLEVGADGQPLDTKENRDRAAAMVQKLAEAVQDAYPGRKVVALEDGIWYVVGGNEMAVLKISRPVPRDFLTIEQLVTLGKHLTNDMKRKGVAA